MYDILIVDDEELVREAMKSIIMSTSLSKNIFFAKNGQQAIDIANENNVDIIFMDIMMPIKNGIEASKQIISKNPSISIYIISSYNSFELAQDALQNNIKKYIIKPIDKSIIIDILKNFNKTSFENNIKLDKQLLELIEKNNFQELYEKIPNLFKNTSNQELTEKSVYGFIINLLGHFFPNKEYDYETVKSLFPLKELYIKDRRLFSIYLFNIFDYIFVTKSKNRYPILNYIFSYIQKNIETDISLDDIVRDCNVSQGYLSRIFKKEFNITIMNYIHIKKINIAKKHICTSTNNISDIYYKIGYSEFSYFCKVFKKYEKITVSNFKNHKYE